MEKLNLTSEGIKVKPFKSEFLLALITKAYAPHKNERLYIDIMALVIDGDNNTLIDHDACWMILDKTFFEKKIQNVYMIPVRIEIKHKDGWNMRMDQADFYFPLAEAYFEAFTDTEITLQKYLGIHADVKPRIKQNLFKFIEFMKAQQ